MQVNRSDKALDAELAWKEFKTDLMSAQQTRDASQRYIRLNPHLGDKPPKLDAKDKLEITRKLTRDDLESYESSMDLQNIAHRLIASTFYFEKFSIETEHVNSESYICKGGSMQSKLIA